jgi:hypothetical protein
MRGDTTRLFLFWMACACGPQGDTDGAGAVDSDGSQCDEPETWYEDADGDGYGDFERATEACEAPAGTVSDATDCNDTDDTVYPDADEWCDGIDHDCDGETDDAEALDAATWYTDADYDGYGDPATGIQTCAPDESLLADASDCNDTDDTVFPDADEWCDGIDNDCDGETDEADALDTSTWYADADHDGYGDPSKGLQACAPGEWQVADTTDCDDSQPTVYPGAEATCDDLDNDCDGTIDGGWRVPSDHADIQSAIDAASGGDTICVEAGSYLETIDFSGKAVRLVGTYGPAMTVIDGNGQGPVVHFQSGEDTRSELIGFTVTGGVSAEGAGVYISDASPRLQDLVIEANSCTESSCYGTGLFVSDGDPEMIDLALRDNVCQATEYCYGTGGYVSSSAGRIDGMWVASNRATSDLYVIGAGLLLGEASTLEAQNLEILDNTGEGFAVFGAGLGIYDYSDIIVSNAIVAGNTGEGSDVYAAGVMVNNGSSPVFINVVIHGNVNDSSRFAFGSGLGVSTSSNAVVINAVVSNNQLIDSGSGSSAAGVWSKGVSSWYYSDIYGNDVADFAEMSSPIGLNGNISINPGFESVSGSDPHAWDLRITASSALVDAGDPSLFDPDSSTSDIGAYGGEGAADWPWFTTIEELRTGDVPEGYTVEVKGVVVTAIDETGFTIQDPDGGEYSGIGVYLGEPPTVARGQEVTILATLGDFAHEARLQVLDTHITGVPGTPGPAELTLSESMDEVWEGVLVTIVDGSLDDPAYDCSTDDTECTDSGLWTLTEGADTLIVYGRCYESDDWADQVGMTPLTGVMTWRWNRHRLMPRSSWDF